VKSEEGGGVCGEGGGGRKRSYPNLFSALFVETVMNVEGGIVGVKFIFPGGFCE
jgi:hypothetical protein